MWTCTPLLQARCRLVCNQNVPPGKQITLCYKKGINWDKAGACIIQSCISHLFVKNWLDPTQTPAIVLSLPAMQCNGPVRRNQSGSLSKSWVEWQILEGNMNSFSKLPSKVAQDLSVNFKRSVYCCIWQSLFGIINPLRMWTCMGQQMGHHA